MRLQCDKCGNDIGQWCLDCLNPIKIVQATIGPMPDALTDPMPKVVVTLENGAVVELFDYYPDEISFTPGEFVGLTYAEGRRLKFKKDVAYLQSPGPAGNARALHGKAAMDAAIDNYRRTGRI